jgi:uncharacterized membrane protein
MKQRPFHRLIYKIFGVALALAGIFLIAKFQHHIIGLILLFVGFYFAMKKGMKPL